MPIYVFGSINIDLNVHTPRFPEPGETISGSGFFTAPGGKGANQAVAASRLGAKTFMIGRVGGDVFGQSLLDSLKQNGVQTVEALVDLQAASGMAVITLNAQGQNTIILAAGANGNMGPADIQRLAGLAHPGGILMLQLEIDLETVVQAARWGHENGLRVILDPAPVQALPEEIYPCLDVITPNEGEAAGLVGFAIWDCDSAARAARILMQRGAKRAVIKMGAQGAYWAGPEGEGFLPVYPVKAVDTVAAGDAFNGGLAAALDGGEPFQQAVKWGMAAGALSTTRAGAQPAMPAREEVLALLNDEG